MTNAASPPPAQRLSSHGIGASEIAAIAGLNPYASPWDVWERKTGRVADDGDRFTEWGHRLEPAIRQAYVDQTGATVHVPSTSMFHPDNHWARATPDGLVLDPSQIAVAIVQCKNVGYWVEKSWSAAPPQYVQLQEQWELFVCGLQRADVAVLIGGNDFRVYTVHRDERIVADLVEIATDFWRRVETKTPPKIDASGACRDHFQRKLIKAEAVEAVADAELEAVFTEWHDMHALLKRGERRVDELKNRVLEAMSDVGTTRIRSELGTAYLIRKGGAGKTTTTTDWKLLAETLGSLKCTPEEFAAARNSMTCTTTSTSPLSVALYPPREWAKENE